MIPSSNSLLENASCTPCPNEKQLESERQRVHPTVLRQAAKPGLVIGIDASRNRSGGAKNHLLGILTAVDPRQYGIAEVHVWSYSSLLQSLPDLSWLVKHNPPSLEKSLPYQVVWQYGKLSKELLAHGCDVLLSTDAGSVCRYQPSVVMSRDMLSFECNEMNRYPFWSFAHIRLFLLRYMQVASLKSASGALFLTQYASDVIQRYTGRLSTVRIIPHGIGDRFRQNTALGLWEDSVKEIRCVYVSNADRYKHQWHVVTAISELRRRGHSLSLRLVGAASGPAKDLVDMAIAHSDPRREFIEVLDAVPHDDIPLHLAHTDIFIFASSCENMPNTLIEAMAAGLPIACSNRGPMPEILQDAGVYFDPENPRTIIEAIEKLISDRHFRHEAALKARKLSHQYSWSRCARETWTYLADVSSDASNSRYQRG